MTLKTGDEVTVRIGSIYLGQGTVTSFSVRGDERIANVETADGCHYALPESELDIKE